MVRLKRCDCGPAFLTRMNRSWWMRLLTSRRLYYCAKCDTELFITRRHLNESASVESTRPALATPPSTAHEASLFG